MPIVGTATTVFMQDTDRQLSLLLLLTYIGLLCACYAHPGQPHDDDPQSWEKYAIEACERGDERAYRAFVERGDLDEDSVRCGEAANDHDNTLTTGD